MGTREDEMHASIPMDSNGRDIMEGEYRAVEVKSIAQKAKGLGRLRIRRLGIIRGYEQQNKGSR